MGKEVARPRAVYGWIRASRGRAVACAAALCFLAACASGDTVASGAADLDTVDRGTPIATTAPVFGDAPPDDPTPIALPTQTAIAVPTATTAALPESVPTTVTPSEAATTSQTSTPVSPAVAATAGPATSDSSPTAAPPTAAPIVGSQTVLAANGGEVYTLNCARCHAENGLGADTSQYSSPLIGVGNRYSTAGMIAELTNGHPVTFGFAQRLSANEIASVVAYVKATFP